MNKTISSVAWISIHISTCISLQADRIAKCYNMYRERKSIYQGIIFHIYNDIMY